jgi:hypothetical protein
MLPTRFFGRMPLFEAVVCFAFTSLYSCNQPPKPPAPPISPPSSATSTTACGTVADCAQKAVEAAQASRDALTAATQQIQGFQSTMNTISQNYSIPLGGTGATGPGGTGVLQSTNTVSCPNGQYLAGLTLGWAGTCHTACDQDGGVLHTVTPICKKLF